MEEKKNSKLKGWLKKIGIAGFMFFLIKGIIWLIIFFGGYEIITNLLQ